MASADDDAERSDEVGVPPVYGGEAVNQHG